MLGAVLEGVISSLGLDPSSFSVSDAVDFRDRDKVYLANVKRPAFLYDKEDGIWLKYGEYINVEFFFNSWNESYRKLGFDSIADNLAIVEVPPVQELIDVLFQSTGTFKIFVDKLSVKC